MKLVTLKKYDILVILLQNKTKLYLQILLSTFSDNHNSDFLS